MLPGHVLGRTPATFRVLRERDVLFGTSRSTGRFRCVLATRTASESLGPEAVFTLVSLHCRGIWGDLCIEDVNENWRALENGDRILSRYNTDFGNFYVITEWDRSVTTVLLVNES